MAKFKTFPHYTVNVKDESAATVLRQEVLPLHRPIFFGFAEKGPIGVPQFGDYTALKEVIGEATFDARSPFFKHPHVFLRKCLEYQQAFFVRLATDDAAVASLVLQCAVKTGVQIPQYERDEFGGIVMENDAPKPLMDGGLEVQEPGVELTWSIRELASDENPADVKPVTDAATSTTTYPVMVLQATSAHAAGNKSGIKMWFDHTSLDQGTVSDIGAMMFNMSIMHQPYGYDTPVPVRDIFSNADAQFAFKPDSIDSATARRVTFEDIIDNEFTTEPLPYDFFVYDNYVELIGDAVVAVETNDVNLTDGWMVDIMSGTNMDGYGYHHVNIITEDADDADGVDVVVMDESVIQYMRGGSDGDLSDEALDSLTNQWLTGDVFVDIYDEARYPITHLYDSGYTIDTKKRMIDFLGIRKDCKVVMSTQDVLIDMNTKAEDQSTGSALRSQLLLHPESVLFGTQVFRGTILQQAGYITDYNWKGIVPATFDCMIKKCIWQGATFFKGKPKGLPNSAVEVFKTGSINWFPNSDDHKQLSWDTGLNYMQYYDMTGFHYADVRSIYPLETSVISDDIFCDMLVYLTHIGRYQWSVFAGRDENPTLLFGDIEVSIAKDIYDKFGQFINAEITVEQTDIDKQLGYQSTVTIAVYGNLPQRVWNIIIPVRREAIAA